MQSFSRELLRIKKQDFDVDRKQLTIHTTKTEKPKILPIAPAWIDFIRPWLDTINDNDLLFPVNQFPRKQWRALCNILDIDITPYQLKHTFATNFYMQTKDILSLQKMLGHADIATTKLYTQIVDEHLRQSVSQFEY